MNELSGSALRAFFNVATVWKLSTAQQRKLLGSPPSSTFFRWKRGISGRVPRDVLERISYVLGIYSALQSLIPNQVRADAWISSQNTAPMFGGHSVLERMLAGNVGDLYVVRQYLDSQLTSLS